MFYILILFIKVPSDKSNFQDGGSELCSEYCVKKYSTDDECDTVCINAMCGYDSGKCKGKEKTVCANSEMPVDNGMKICKNFDKTCCSDEEMEYLTNKYANMSQYINSATCKEYIEYIVGLRAQTQMPIT